MVEPVAPGVPGGPSLATLLRYEISVVPKLSIPSALVAHVIRCGLPANLTAIARRAEQVMELLLRQCLPWACGLMYAFWWGMVFRVWCSL